MVSLITLTNGYQIFIPRFWDYKDFIAAYITLPVFIVLWIGHKLVTRSWRQWYIPVDKIDVFTGLEEIEELTNELDEKRVPPNNAWDKFLDALL